MSHKLDSNNSGASPILSTRIPEFRSDQLDCISEMSGVVKSTVGRAFIELGMASMLGETDHTQEARRQVEKWLSLVADEERPGIPVEVLQAGVAIHEKLQKRRREVVEKALAKVKKNSTSR